jgi:hypothetical protein
MNPKDYTNHSGGAKGADMMWDEIGRKYGVMEHVHWRPNDLEHLPENILVKMLTDVKNAALILKRPWIGFRGIELVHRNWLQVRYAEAIYAIAHIVIPGNTDYRGFVNDTGKEIVAGGTGWAVEMAIQAGKPVYVFNMGGDQWHEWCYETSVFTECDVPILAKDFAGIGSRILTPEGTQAIENVYIKTFNNEKEI